MQRAIWLPAALRARNLHVELVRGWETRGSDIFDPQGVLAHHTASAPGKNAPSLNTVVKGRPDLPGPLCHVLLARDGTCYVVAAGRANHAGKGLWKGLTSNTHLLGIEAENDGVGEHWPAVQLDAYQRCVAAMLEHLGKDASWCAGHKEYALPKGRKIDPTGIDMDAFRKGVSALLAHTPPPPEEEAMFIAACPERNQNVLSDGVIRQEIIDTAHLGELQKAGLRTVTISGRWYDRLIDIDLLKK